ncbi:MAG: type III pantothenate kinase [bacterium]
MILVVDVGNTNTVLGVYNGDTLVRSWRIQTQRGRTSDEHGVMLGDLLGYGQVERSAIAGTIISSVVPPMEHTWTKTTQVYLGHTPLVVGKTADPQMPILYENPVEVGADRLVNAVAAWERHHTALVIVDFGTATTFDAISDKGEYLGGAIAPGVTVASEALYQAASKLPRVEIARPRDVIGTTTVDAIQSGLLYGYTGLVNEIVGRMKVRLGDNTTVVATGGLARFIAGETHCIDEVDDLLTLEGLRLIYLRNT